MKFDFCIGNPPYQEDDGGQGRSARPVYNVFVEAAQKLTSGELVMIIPSRWFVGGKGLDSFREMMLSDHHLRRLVDYENYRDVFPNLGGLAGGACYFAWDPKYDGKCEVVNCTKTSSNADSRYLDEFSVFIRQNEAVQIVRKICSYEKNFLDKRVSSRKPFGLPTNYEPRDHGVPCWFIQRIGLKYADKTDVEDSRGLLNRWKFLLPKAPIAGQTDFSKPVGFYYDGNTRIAKPGECCTESYIVGGSFDTENEVINYRKYLYTKLARFLLLQSVVSQDVTRKNFCFVPDLMDYTSPVTDNDLRNRWRITDDEWKYIDSRISSVEPIAKEMA